MNMRKPLVLLFVLFCVTAANAQELPLVLGVFEFGDGVCPRKPNRVQQAGKLSGIVLDEISDTYRFVDWNTIDGGRRVTGRFIARLDRVRTGNNKYAFYLSYHRDIRGSVLAPQMSAVGDKNALYATDERTHPCTDDSELEKRVRTRVKSDIERFDTDIEKNFFSHITLMHAIPKPDEVVQAKLVIDLPWMLLFAAPASKVQIIVPDQLALALGDLGRHNRPQGHPVVCGKVVDFSAGDPGDFAQIVAALKQANAERATVVMAAYDRDTDAPNRPAGHATARPSEPE